MKHFAADLSYNGESCPGETALLMEGAHCPALPSVPSDNSLHFVALNQAMKVSHVLYF